MKAHRQAGCSWWGARLGGVLWCLLGLVFQAEGAPRSPQDVLPISDPLAHEDAKLTASDAAARDEFGRSVALSNDGRTALIGTDNAACSTGIECGAAYVFVRETGGAWVQQQKLTPSDAAPFRDFGISVALSANGETALVGAPGGAGAAYVFVRTGNQWIEDQKLTASGAGRSVALSADGRTAVIGAMDVAYVFTRARTGAWLEAQTITASGAARGDGFGLSVDLSADGKTALFGALFANCAAGEDCGAAYVFAREKGGTWVQQQKLTASDLAAQAAFGFSVSLSADGQTAVIGAPNDFCPSGNMFCGAAYVFVRQRGSWVEQQKLTVSNAVGGGVFGFSVALAAGGRTALVGDRGAECPAV
jgi:hypothetical protein